MDYGAQNRQSAKLFLQSSEFGGRVPSPTRGHTVHCGTVSMCTLCYGVYSTLSPYF
jgi:hypothetical protein